MPTKHDSLTDDERQARDATLRILSRREHTRAELALKLRARKFSESLIGSTLQSMQDEGLQSDQRASEVYIRQRTAKGYGELKIRAELQSKGVAGDVISQCLDEADVDWLELAIQVVEKKASVVKPGDRKALQKQQRFLASRGFTSDIVRRVTAGQTEYLD